MTDSIMVCADKQVLTFKAIKNPRRCPSSGVKEVYDRQSKTVLAYYIPMRLFSQVLSHDFA